MGHASDTPPDPWSAHGPEPATRRRPSAFITRIGDRDTTRERGAWPGRRWRRAWFGLTLLLLTATVALILSAGGHSGQPPTAGASTKDVAALPAGLDRRPAPRIRLADARGGFVDTRALRGRPYLVTFLYVDCPDVCPLISQDLRTALGELGPQAGRVAVVAVSVDPRGDTRPAVRAFLRRHRLPRNFHYGIGSERALTPIWRAYFAAPQVPGRPDSAHTAAVWFVDARGRWRGRMPAGTSVDAGVVARRLRALLREAA